MKHKFVLLSLISDTPCIAGPEY